MAGYMMVGQEEVYLAGFKSGIKQARDLVENMGKNAKFSDILFAENIVEALDLISSKIKE